MKFPIQVLFLAAFSLASQLALCHGNNYSDTNSSDWDPTEAEIRGGYPSPPIPYYGVFQGYGVICGASLVHGDIALTAAHCVPGGFPPSLRFNTNQRTGGGTSATVTSRTLHPLWTGSLLSADLAILKLSSFLSFPTASSNGNGGAPSASGELMFVAGFGLTSDTSGVSSSLQATTIPYRTDCALEGFDNVRMICGDSSVTATCGGDSGSPIFLDGTTIQVGVNSWSDGSCNVQTVDVYTRVSYYADWIQSQICQQSSAPPTSCAGYTPPPAPAPGPSPTPGPNPAPTLKPGCLFPSLRGAITDFFGY